MVERIKSAPAKFLIAVSEIPKRYPLAICGALLGLTIALAVLGYLSYGTQRQVDVLRPQITQINKTASACTPRSLKIPAKAADCAERIRIGLENCRLDPACRRAFLSNLRPPPRPASTPAQAQRQDRSLPASTAAGDETGPNPPNGTRGGQGGPTGVGDGGPKGGDDQGGGAGGPKPAPPAEPAPDEDGGQGGGAPAEGDQGEDEGGGQQAGSGSAGVEVCALGSCTNVGVNGSSEGLGVEVGLGGGRNSP